MNLKGAGVRAKGQSPEMTVDNANHRCGLLVSAVWETEKPRRRVLHAGERELQRRDKFQGVKVRRKEK